MAGFRICILGSCFGSSFILSETKEKDGSWIYVVGFSKDKKINIQDYFKLEKPLPDEDGYSFMAVKDLDLIVSVVPSTI